MSHVYCIIPQVPGLIQIQRKSSEPDGPCRAFICGVCNNVTFSSLESLERHCQLVHPDTAAAPRGQETALGAIQIGSSGDTFSSLASKNTRVSAWDFIDKSGGYSLSTISVAPIARIGPMESTYTIIPVEQDPLTGSQQAVALEVLPLLVPPKFKCTVCGSSNFNTQGELDMHTLEHQEIQVTKSPQPLQSFICEECDLPFVSLADRNRHLMSIHDKLKGNLPGYCPICKVVQKLSKNIPRHVHAVHDMWLCNACPQVFKEEIQRRRHKELHAGYGNGNGKLGYRCLECLEVFASLDFIREHYEIMHFGGDKCTCVTCNIQLQRKHLKTHLEIHQLESSTLKRKHILYLDDHSPQMIHHILFTFNFNYVTA